jgi:hypothetical protein
MKGYLSFLLVFVSVFMILTLIEVSQLPSQISFSKAIAAERVYQVQMNAKEVALESVRHGGISAFKLYNETHKSEICKTQSPNHPNCFRSEEAIIWTKAGSFVLLSLLERANFDSDIKVNIFCTDSMTDSQLIESSKEVREGRAPESIKAETRNATDYVQFLLSSVPTTSNGLPNYSMIKGPDCYSIINPLIENNPADINAPSNVPLENPILKHIELDGVIVMRAYYPAFNISSVAYVPAGSKVFP